MQTLVIFNLIPEDTKYYLVPEAPDWLLALNGKIQNCDDLSDEEEKSFERFSNAVADKPECYIGTEQQLAGQWAKYEVKMPLVLEGLAQVMELSFLL